jgi:hypothetical protein
VKVKRGDEEIRDSDTGWRNEPQRPKDLKETVFVVCPFAFTHFLLATATVWITDEEMAAHYYGSSSGL